VQKPEKVRVGGVEYQAPLVVSGGGLAKATQDQTVGIGRLAAFTPESIEKGIWFGRAQTPPREASIKHHHGEAATTGFILQGRARVYFGEEYEQFIEAGPGDFVFVPPFLPHYEENPGDEPGEMIFARVPGNIVVHLE
jgi:uncharacterized RmlC-like cupin family protein